MLVELRPWSENGVQLLRELNAPELKAHLGGPETASKIQERHMSYLNDKDPGRTEMFEIWADVQPAGSIGYWERHWRNGLVYETGWAILGRFQRQGVATRGTAQLLALLEPIARRRFVHAFPSAENVASNAICRALGFELLGPCEFEYPPGETMLSNDWRFDLRVPNNERPQIKSRNGS